MMGGYGGMGGWGMGFGWIVGIVVMALIVWGLVGAFRPHRNEYEEDFGAWRSAADRSADQALSILKERYARGELDEETYWRMRGELEV